MESIQNSVPLMARSASQAKVYHRVATFVLLFGLFSTPVFARCLENQQLTADQLSQEAANTADEIDRLILLKRSLKVCPAYKAWIELGKVELELENYIDAAYAFEKAVDYHQDSGKTDFTVSELQRIAIANSWLAETYALNDELAYALVATQEAVASFDALGQAVPDRLLVLQAKLDDATSQADAAVLARSFEIQHQRASRGIGVRPRVRQETEPAQIVADTQDIVEDYTGETPTAPIIVASNQPEPESTDAQSSVPSESRLNIPVLFEFDCATLTPSSLSAIEKLGSALLSLELTASDSVRVLGHTDSRGAADYNLFLSEQRAQSVADTLLSMLGNDVRLIAEGHGESELRYAGNLPDDHRRNRRVELIVVRQ